MPKRKNKSERRHEDRQRELDNWCHSVAAELGLEFEGAATENDQIRASSHKKRGRTEKTSANSLPLETSPPEIIPKLTEWCEAHTELLSAENTATCFRINGCTLCRDAKRPEDTPIKCLEKHGLLFVPRVESMKGKQLSSFSLSILGDARHCLLRLNNPFWALDCFNAFQMVFAELVNRGGSTGISMDAVHETFELTKISLQGAVEDEGLTKIGLMNVVGCLDRLFFEVSYSFSTREQLPESTAASHLRYLRSHLRNPSAIKNLLSLKRAFFGSLDEATTKLFAKTYGLSLETMEWNDVADTDAENPLLSILRCSFDESLFLVQGLGIDTSVDFKVEHNYRSDGKKKKKKKKKRHKSAGSTSHGDGRSEEGGYRGTGARAKPVAPSFLENWRNSKRDWACRFYAYATPNDEALSALEELGPLIEVGAGTGYWMSLLQKRGCNTLAYDVHAGRTESKNQYHRLVKRFMNVQEGTSRVLSLHSDRALFLCYPPPDNSMASECLQNYTGHTVAYIGEFQGTTANDDFERNLVAQFKLVRTINLPNFSDQICTLSIWKRRTDELKALTIAQYLAAWPIRCRGCGARGHPGITRLFRCRVCRSAVYCSEKCGRSNKASHNALHELCHAGKIGAVTGVESIKIKKLEDHPMYIELTGSVKSEETTAPVVSAMTLAEVLQQ